MLSLLPSTQLILALWLLAAVAPAATALLNGSLVPFGAAEVRTRVSARESGAVLKTEAKPIEDESALDWLACEPTSTTDGPEQLRVEAVSPCESSDILPSRASSVLQTELQRHRPKVA